MTPEIQQQLIYAGIAMTVFFFVVVVITILIIAGRRLSNRVVGSGVAVVAKPCGGNCGCNCATPPRSACVPAIDCAPPFAHPVAIHGLSCDPSNPQFAYAGDIQSYVDAMNKQREIERQAQSLERLEETVRWMRQGQMSAPASKSSK